MIVWVVALRSEAAPLIEARRLRRQHAGTAWPLYLGRGEEEALVICGVGRGPAAAACRWAGSHLRPGRDCGWINAGIAGGTEGPLGRVVLGRRVVEVATGRSWCPAPVSGVGLARETVFTVDAPEQDFAVSGVYEMEASGFLAGTEGWGRRGLTQVVKIVSDTPQTGVEQLDRDRVRELVASRVEELIAVAESVSAITSGQ